MHPHCKRFTIVITMASLLAATAVLANDTDTVSQELDAYWAELGRTVATGDFQAYAAGYHPDAVYVSASKGESYPIASAFSRWQPGFEQTRLGETRASVTFRFSQRLHDATTAHETGIFRYTSQAAGEPETEQFMHFEALLVKQDGWLTVMEYQKAPASREQWQALAAAPPAAEN